MQPVFTALKSFHHVLSTIYPLLQGAPGRRSTNVGNDGGVPWSVLLLMALILGLIVLYVWSSVRAIQPFRIEASTTLPPNAAVDHITERYIRAEWSAHTFSDGRVLFSRTTKPDTGTTILLALFFVIPALLYLLTSQRHQTAELQVVESAGRRTSLEILGNTTGYGGVNTAASILRSLPK